MIALEVIASADRLREFEPEWLEFTGTVLPETPFQTHAWLTTWWDSFGSGELRVMVFRHAGRVAGVLPLFLHEWNGRRQLTLIGSGISDYLDPLFAPEGTAEIVDRIRRELTAWKDWDVCDWQDLSYRTPLGALGPLAEDTPCLFVPIGKCFADYLAARPKDLKRNLRRYKEKAEAIAPVDFEAVTEARGDLLSALTELHRARWNKVGESGTIEANGAERFLRAAVPQLARHKAAAYFVVRFRGRIAAILLALCNESTIFSWLSAFDPEFESFGFGRELLAQAIRYAHDCGYIRWNFLRGEEPYKFSWGAQKIEKRRLVLLR